MIQQWDLPIGEPMEAERLTFRALSALLAGSQFDRAKEVERAVRGTDRLGVGLGVERIDHESAAACAFSIFVRIDIAQLFRAALFLHPQMIHPINS
jgi:hypothetical protein